MSRWIGQLDIHRGWARWRGLTGASDWHRHIAAQAVVACDGCITVEGRDGAESEGTTVLVEPMAWHRVPSGRALEMTFCDPWADAASLATAGLPSGRCLSQAPIVGRATAPFWPPLIGTEPVSPRLARSAWAIAAGDWVAQRLADADPGRILLVGLARHVGLSADHARHRFASEFGLPFRRYVLWERLRLAASGMQAGQGPTAAAHTAGFADAAHLARTLKTMFGVTASQVF
jgi:AraC-like DNA-binding protein